MSQQNFDGAVANRSNSGQESGEAPLENTRGLDDCNDPQLQVDGQRENNESRAKQAQSDVAAPVNPRNGTSTNETGSVAEPTLGYDAAAANRNFRWHLMQTRSSKRRQSSITPGLSPGAKRPSAKS